MLIQASAVILKKIRTLLALRPTSVAKPKDVQVFSLEEDDPLLVV